MEYANSTIRNLWRSVSVNRLYLFGSLVNGGIIGGFTLLLLRGIPKTDYKIGGLVAGAVVATLLGYGLLKKDDQEE